MKNIYIFNLVFLSFFLSSQELVIDENPEKIVDKTIYSQVDASAESADAQKKIDNWFELNLNKQ